MKLRRRSDPCEECSHHNSKLFLPPMFTWCLNCGTLTVESIQVCGREDDRKVSLVPTIKYEADAPIPNPERARRGYLAADDNDA